MHHRPADIDERELRCALSEWGIEAVSLDYLPAGFGDHHWIAEDVLRGRWFVTVADPEHKEHCGRDPQAAFRGLCRAMDTAAELRDREGLDFVVAPSRTAHGETVRWVGSRYALSVFPWMEGNPGEFGRALTPRERGLIVDMLADLHRRRPPTSTPVLSTELSLRTDLERALRTTGRPWRGGPFAEQARALISDHATGLRRRLVEFDRRAEEVSGEPVVTHGEPHPGNLLWVRNRFLLVDWDTVGLAVPERDLWLVATEPDDLARYEEAGGRRPGPSALELYRLRWALEDVAVYVDWFRSPHEWTADTEQAWEGMTDIVERLTEDVGLP